MKQFILILSILSLLLFGVWGCPEKTEQSKKGAHYVPLRFLSSVAHFTRRP